MPSAGTDTATAPARWAISAVNPSYTGGATIGPSLVMSSNVVTVRRPRSSASVALW